MKQFMVRLVLFLLAPIPFLYLLNHIVDSGLRKSRYFYYSEWNDLFDGKINADMLVMGSSRAWVQVSPKILDSTLHLNSYNLGLDASCFEMQYERLKLYLAHNKKPRYIIQEVGFITTMVRFPDLPGTQQFLPYLNDPAVWQMIKSHKTTLNFTDRYFPMYKYNNEYVVIAEGLKSYFGKGVKGEKYKGYQGSEKMWDSSFYTYKLANPHGVPSPLDSDAVAIFKDYLNFCRANDIKVIMVFPPVFYQALNYINNYRDFVALYDQLSASYHIPFYNYMNDSLCYTRDNFYNSQHMNRKAAELFTERLAERIRDDNK